MLFISPPIPQTNKNYNNKMLGLLKIFKSQTLTTLKFIKCRNTNLIILYRQ